MEDQTILKKINMIIGEYLATGNSAKAKRQLAMLRLNTEKSKGLGERTSKLIEKIELAKKMI